MNRLVIIYLTFILCLSLSFALQVTITADFNNTKNVDRLGTLDWFIEPTNGNKTINVTGYCLEEDASKITIPQKQSNGQPGTVRKTCTITDKELLKRYYSFYTYATFSYMQPETIDGSPKIVYYTFPTPKSREFKFDNFIENVIGGANDYWDSIFGIKKTCDKDPTLCSSGDFCYLIDEATTDLNTVDKMTQRLNDDPTLKARIKQAFLIIDESPDNQKFGCLPKSTKEFFDLCSPITDQAICQESENHCFWLNGKCYGDTTLSVKAATSEGVCTHEIVIRDFYDNPVEGAKLSVELDRDPAVEYVADEQGSKEYSVGPETRKARYLASKEGYLSNPFLSLVDMKYYDENDKRVCPNEDIILTLIKISEDGVYECNSKLACEKMILAIDYHILYVDPKYKNPTIKLTEDIKGDLQTATLGIRSATYENGIRSTTYETGLNILAGINFTFDCAGHTIEGSGLPDLETCEFYRPGPRPDPEHNKECYGSSRGIYLGSADKLTIQNCVIKNFISGIALDGDSIINGVTLKNNWIENCRYAVGLGTYVVYRRERPEYVIDSNVFLNSYPQGLVVSDRESISTIVTNNVFCLTEPILEKEAEENIKFGTGGYGDQAFCDIFIYLSGSCERLKGFFGWDDNVPGLGKRNTDRISASNNICNSGLCETKCSTWNGKSLPDGTLFSTSASKLPKIPEKTLEENPPLTTLSKESKTLQIIDSNGNAKESYSIALDDKQTFRAQDEDNVACTKVYWVITKGKDYCTLSSQTDIQPSVKGISEGTCTLKAECPKGGVSAEAEIQVRSGESQDEETYSIKCTSTSQKNYECKLYDSSNKQVTGNIEWTYTDVSGNSCTFTEGKTPVSKLTFKSKGTCVVKAKWNSQDASLNVDYNPDSSSQTLTIGFMLNNNFFGLSDKDEITTGEKTYYARLSGSSSNLQAVWTVSPADVCSGPGKSATTKGVLTAKSEGTCKLTAEYSDNGNLIDQSIDIKITEGKKDETKTCDEACGSRPDACRSKCKNSEENDEAGNGWCDKQDNGYICCCEEDNEPAEDDTNEPKSLEIVPGVKGEFEKGGMKGWSYSGGTVGTRKTGENWFFHGEDPTVISNNPLKKYVPEGEMKWTSVGPSSVCKQLTISRDEVLVKPIGAGTCKITGTWNGETDTLSIEVVE